MHISLKTATLMTMVLIFSSCHKVTQSKDQYTPILSLKEAYSSGDYTKWPKPTLDSLIDLNTFEDIGVLPEMNYPKENPYSKAKEELGKTLFFDPRLSVSGQIACASCHNPELAWTDNSTRSFGHNRQTGARNAMTILNVGYAHELFWDGRATSLEDQARFPIADAVEMNEDLNIAVNKIAEIEGYKPLFKEAFGSDSVSLKHIQYAIATFERGMNSYKTKFDKFVGGDATQLNDQEVLGLHLFRTQARCINCHNTPYFSDNQYHNDGQTLFGTKNEDFGRFMVTKDTADIGKFRTPTLREVARTGPWMHNGHFPSLLDVVEFYNLGNPAPIQKKYIGTKRDSLIPENSKLLKRLDLNKAEVHALLAFIETLNSSRGRINIPELPK